MQIMSVVNVRQISVQRAIFIGTSFPSFKLLFDRVVGMTLTTSSMRSDKLANFTSQNLGLLRGFGSQSSESIGYVDFTD